MKLWKKLVAGIMLGVFATGIAGCGGDEPKKEAASSKEVTVYMGVVEQQALVLAQEFEKDTGIKVNFMRFSSGEALASRSANTPYQAMTLPAVVTATLLRGRITARHGNVQR